MKHVCNFLFASFLLTSTCEAFSPLAPSPSTTTTTTSLDASQTNVSTFAKKFIGSTALGTALSFGTIILPPQPVFAAESSTVVGELKGSGLVFKDTLQIERFEDPKVKGVELYISNFQRPITEKLNNGFFNDPSNSSVACARTGKVAIADNINKSTGGEEVFKESKSLLFKDLKVQRIYDTDTNTVVYVSYNTRLVKNDDANKSRFASSLCAVNLND